MKLRAQIFSGYILMSVLVIAVGVTGYVSVRTVSHNFDGAVNRTQPVLTALQNLRQTALMLAVSAIVQSPAAEAAEEKPPEAAEGAASDVEGLGDAAAEKLSAGGLDRRFAHYRDLVAHHFPDELEDAAEIKERIEGYSAALGVLAALPDSAAPALRQEGLTRMSHALDALLEAIAESAEGEENEFREYQETVDREKEKHTYGVMFAVLASVLASLLGGAMLAGHIALPVRKLRQAVEQLGTGKLGERVEIVAANEIGDLSRAFNRMADDLSSTLVSRNFVELVLESLSDGVVVIDQSGRIVRCNSAMRRIYNKAKAGPLAGRSVDEVFLNADGSPLLAGSGSSLQRHECRLEGPGGTETVVSVSASALSDASGSDSRVLMVQDITERKRSEDRLHFLASYDVLTGLPNRRMFLDQLKQVLARVPWNKLTVGVLFCDLDRFKFVNDSLGHAVGDALLQRVTERIREVLRPGDLVGRWAGDEFVVFLNELAAPEHADEVGRKLVARLREPVQVGMHELFVTVSVGAACAPVDGMEADELVKNADLAMYAAKAEGKNLFCHYNAGMRERTEMRLQLEHSLRAAIADQAQLKVHFQAQQSLSGGLIGFEALVRWQHPELGLISPAQFLPAAEEAGLMAALDARVLRLACAQLKALHDAGWSELRVAVNLSNQTFQRSDLVDLIRSEITQAAVPFAAVELELTEQIVMENVGSAVETMNALCALGVSLSIDDFGTGYSSLSQLKRCPIRLLKIDRSFVTDVTSDASDQAITLAIIALSHKLGIQVLAEGVETDGQLELLRNSGCDGYQGYLLSKPLPAEALFPWLESRGDRRSA